MKWKNVWMLKVRGCLDLREESISSDDCSELGPQNFDCDMSIVLDVVCEIDSRHSARAKLSLDSIPFTDCGGQSRGNRCVVWRL